MAQTGGTDGYDGRRKNLHELMDEELKDSHGEKINSIAVFMYHNKNLTEEEIVNQREDQSLTPLESQNGGPNIRYIQDPLNPNAVIDLRHMLVIGRLSVTAANTVEVAQGSAFWDAGIRSSAGNYQDYYSNDLGRQFYKEYEGALRQSPNSFSTYLFNFLHNYKVGRLNKHGGYDYYGK